MFFSEIGFDIPVESLDKNRQCHAQQPPHGSLTEQAMPNLSLLVNSQGYPMQMSPKKKKIEMVPIIECIPPFLKDNVVTVSLFVFDWCLAYFAIEENSGKTAHTSNPVNSNQKCPTSALEAT